MERAQPYFYRHRKRNGCAVGECMTYSHPGAHENHRHECEVRYIERMSNEARAEYLAGVARKRGQASADKLLDDVKGKS